MINQNYYEELIDQMMIDSFPNQFKEKISSMSTHDKRMAILSLLDKDRNLFLKIKSLVNDTKVSKIDHLKEVILFLRDYVKIAETERKKLGEIFTPFDELAKPMVNLVEKYDTEFWKNPNHKVLDSSAGYGTFLVLAAYKFMDGLKDWEPDSDRRFKYIVENCLYYGDIQPKSAFIWLSLIDPFDEYETNTYCGSFLEEGFDKHAKEVWGVEKWDLIIQNPPYQQQKEGFKKTQPLWHLFVQKSLSLVVENGYMVMVHPSGWRNVDGIFKETQRKIKENQILELHIHSEKEGLNIFGAETRFDYYIIRNSKKRLITKIRCQNGSIDNADLGDMEFIPNGSFSDLMPLISKNSDRVLIMADSSYHTQREFMSKNLDELYVYPCVYTVKSGDVATIWYSSKNTNGHFGIPKLVWSNFRISSAGSLIDKFGTYGLTQFSYAIIDSVENLEKIKKVFDSSKFRKIMEDCSVGDMSINRKVISTFKKDFWRKFL